MRTIKQLAVPQDTNLAKWPQGQIQNETDTLPGTPVIREIYGDILTNIYKILELTGIIPDGTEDAEDTQYQIVNALRKWTNELNDKEQVLSLAGTVWSVPFDLSLLPDKYVFIAKTGDAYDSAQAYTFKGTEVAPVYSFISSTGFNASDEVLVIIDQAEVRVISLTQLTASSIKEFTVFGVPLAFNDTDVLRYESVGNILSDIPSVVDLQTQIRTLSADPLAEIMNIVILKGFVLCFVYLPNTITYKFYHFDINDLNTAIAVPITGIAIPIGTDNTPYFFTDGVDLYITNSAGTTVNDFEITKLSYSPATPTIAFISTISLNVAFKKTTNSIIKGGELFTLINSELRKYNLGSGVQTIIDDFKALNGVLFLFNGSVYYTNGEVATKWVI